MILLMYALVGVNVLQAAGQGETAPSRQQDPIEQANQLVDEGRLNEAMLLLEESVRQNPDLIEDAEDVMDRIRAQRAAYNEEFQRLIDNLVNSPENIERTLAIIDRMEELDQFPNERVVEQVTEARVIAQLAYDRNRAETIMAEARRLIAEGRYADAVERYLSGFDLQRERFEEREYGNVFRNRVDEAVARIRSNAEGFIALSPGYRSDVQSLRDAAEQGLVDPLPELLAAYADVFARIETRETEVSAAASVLTEQGQQVSDIFPEDPVDWHIRFVRRFAEGRPDAEEPEGIVGALRTAQSRSRFELAGTFADRADQRISQAVAASTARQWNEAVAQLVIARENARAGLQLATVGTEATPEQSVEAAYTTLPEGLRSLYVSEHVRRETALARSSLAQTMAEVDASRLPVEDAEDLDALAQSKSALEAHVVQLRGQLTSWIALGESYAILGPQALSSQAQEYLTATEAALETRENEVVEYEIETLDRIAGLRLTGFSRRFETGQEDYERGLDLLEGVEEVVEASEQQAAQESEPEVEGEPEQVTVTYRYPDRALEEFRATQQDLQTLRAEVQTALESYREEEDYVRLDGRIQERIADTQTLLNEIDELAETVASRITSAQDQIARAEELREAGDQLVAQTRQAINNLQVEQARELWETARQRYFESLELQQDAAFRQQTDELIAQLGREIQEARNRRIVQEVRQRIDQADTLYEQESYQQAYELLTEARDLWQQTNVQPNPEIERLLRFVNAALNLESTRSLAETEPLYPVLSSYLNLARQDFTQARNVVEEQGTGNQARQLLVRAEENVDNVIAVRPYNWEARILKLRILRLQDSENFDEVFERRYEEAVAQKEQNPQEALTAFETLAAINPDYPGLQDQIVELEIELGIRPDPVTQAQIAESNRLFSQAQEIASGAGEAQRQAAISVLEEAVTLNPENREAQILLDRLRIQSGGEATVTLSSAEEQQFRRAETLFIQDNVAQAYAIVQQLLQDEENRRYPPLLDLEERISARLGI